jgi:lysyl-tRNA synthetase class 2
VTCAPQTSGPEIPKSNLAIRSRLLHAVRGFFAQRDFLEVETPVRIPNPALELHIDAVPSGQEFLRTSPELHMKRLLVSGCDRIYQLGPCFRQGESGAMHNPEFTMLEWYRAEAGYLDVLDDTRDLLLAVLAETIHDCVLSYRGERIDFAAEWARLSVRDVFREFAGWDPVEAFDPDRFDVDLGRKVEPRLPRDRPVVLKDYPVEVAALARVRGGPPRVAERWELYAGGIELANAFSELTDHAQQRRRFTECARQRESAGREVYALDTAFLAALEQGMPASAGVALGIDRLAMLLTGAASIDEVRLFCRE